MIISISLVAILVVTTIFYMRQPKFGQAPSGEHLQKISESSNFKDRMFRNLTFTPGLSDGHSYSGILYDQFFRKHPRTAPKDTLPSKKIDLNKLSDDENVLVWFGHSSYFIQLDGKRILVDPVFSGNASPIPGTVKAFKETDRYSVEDIPEIDYLLISHDHYDHLDYKTIKALKKKVKNVYCGLGVGSHFEKWGFEPEQINEQDWYNSVEADAGFFIHTMPARHFSGRGFTRKNTLWASYVLQTPSQTIYIGGDSGYDTFFAEIGEKFDSIDLAILDNGQYNDAWKEIHMHPDQVLKAAQDLKAKRLFPVHSSKFVLAMHPWDEPLKEITRINEDRSNPIPLFTPLIGEKIDLNDSTRVFEKWWEGIN